MYYAIMINSAYSDARMSESRLQLTLKTAVPSLRSQTLKPVIHVDVYEHDPFVTQRIQAFESTGCPVVPVWNRELTNWNLPDERRLMSRLDDDDMISFDFCEKTMNSVIGRDGNIAVIWPNGYVLKDGKLHELTHNRNQFVSLATSLNLHPHNGNHHNYYAVPGWENVFASEERGWCWVRHSLAKTKTRRVYVKSSPVSVAALSRRFSHSLENHGRKL